MTTYTRSEQKARRARLDEVAKRINAHLKRFEADPVINAPDPKYGLTPYYWAGAFAYYGKVEVKYVSFQCSTRLTIEYAEAYLAWLDAGNVGRHYEALREARKP